MPKKKIDPLIRFHKNIELIPFSECWHWTGPVDKDGYGYFWLDKTTRAHRFAITLKEPINKDLVIDHICKNRACVNPRHLRQVSTQDNVLLNSDGLAQLNKKKTHCKSNHEFNSVNTGRDYRGDRFCKKCAVRNTMKYYYKKKAHGTKDPATT